MVDPVDAMYTLGLELEGNMLKCAQVAQTKGKPQIQNIFEIPIDDVNPLYIPNTQTKILDLSNHYLFITALPSHEVLVRSLEIKLKKEKDIDAVLAFQSEPLIPYPIENAILDKIIVDQTPEGTQLTILVARKDHVSQHLNQWKAFQIEPEAVSCVPVSLAAFAKRYYALDDLFFLLHLGRYHTSCLLIKEGKLIAAQGFAKGLNHLETAYETDCRSLSKKSSPFEELNFASLSQNDFPLLFEAKEAIRLDVLRIFYSLSKQTKGKNVEEIVMTGEGAQYAQLTDHLCQNLNKRLALPVEEMDASLHKFAVSLGSALSAQSNGSELVNFRKGDLAYPYPWKRYKKSLMIYFALSLLLAGVFYLFGEVYLKYQEDRVKKEYVDLLAIMNKPYTSFEEEFRLKFPPENPADDEKIPQPQNLSLEELSQRMSYLDKELQSSPDTFPLLPNVPRVSDVLAWLTTHPILSQQNAANPISSTPIQIESFAYTMVKRPEQTKKQEKYQAKVELEFTTPTPKQAREFHDALIAPNDFVDPKGEIKWSSNRGKYRTSFFLKDKTAYPSSTL